MSAGTYQVTVTAAACAGKQNAPVVTLSTAIPRAGSPPGAFPVAWVGPMLARATFTVYTGDVSSGTFTATTTTFDVQDVCGTP